MEVKLLCDGELSIIFAEYLVYYTLLWNEKET